MIMIDITKEVKPLKLQLKQETGIKDTEINIKYSILTNQLKHIIHYIHQSDYTLKGFIDNNLYYISIHDILYLDTTDRKTFIYTKDKIYECKKNIITLEKELVQTSFVRTSKTTLLNISVLQAVQPYPNHRILAQLNNGEKLIVSRKYIPDLKEKLRSSYYV